MEFLLTDNYSRHKSDGVGGRIAQSDLHPPNSVCPFFDRNRGCEPFIIHGSINSCLAYYGNTYPGFDFVSSNFDNFTCCVLSRSRFDYLNLGNLLLRYCGDVSNYPDGVDVPYADHISRVHRAGESAHLALYVKPDVSSRGDVSRAAV